MSLSGGTDEWTTAGSFLVFAFPDFDLTDSSEVGTSRGNKEGFAPSSVKNERLSFDNKGFTYKSRQMVNISSFNFQNIMLLAKLYVYLQ